MTLRSWSDPAYAQRTNIRSRLLHQSPPRLTQKSYSLALPRLSLAGARAPGRVRASAWALSSKKTPTAVQAVAAVQAQVAQVLVLAQVLA
jgi:hypothetical protein